MWLPVAQLIGPTIMKEYCILMLWSYAILAFMVGLLFSNPFRMERVLNYNFILGFELPPRLILPTATETFNGLKAMAKEIAAKLP
jgi:hypothetical protein